MEGRTAVASAERCPSCNTTMYRDQEKYYSAGTEVVYLCRNDSCPTYVKSGNRQKVKAFIDKK
jgi:hypothetical protein